MTTPAQKTPQKTRLADQVKARPALVVGMLALVLVVVVGGGAAVARLTGGATSADGPRAGWAPATPPPLLPGETLWHGVPSMLWGTNDTQNWDAEKNLITLPAIQKQAKADHLALIRTWLFQVDLVTNQPVTDAYQQSKVQAALNTGARLLCELPTRNSMAYDERMVTLFCGQVLVLRIHERAGQRADTSHDLHRAVDERDPQAAQDRSTRALRRTRSHHPTVQPMYLFGAQHCLLHAEGAARDGREPGTARLRDVPLVSLLAGKRRLPVCRRRTATATR